MDRETRRFDSGSSQIPRVSKTDSRFMLNTASYKTSKIQHEAQLSGLRPQMEPALQAHVELQLVSILT